MAFDIFDINDNGLLSDDELRLMVTEIYGKKGISHDLKLIVKKLDKNKDNAISRSEFVGAANLFPALLFPAFHMQTEFQKKIGGEDFWREKTLQAQSWVYCSYCLSAELLYPPSPVISLTVCVYVYCHVAAVVWCGISIMNNPEVAEMFLQKRTVQKKVKRRHGAAKAILAGEAAGEQAPPPASQEAHTAPRKAGTGNADKKKRRATTRN